MTRLWQLREQEVEERGSVSVSMIVFLLCYSSSRKVRSATGSHVEHLMLRWRVQVTTILEMRGALKCQWQNTVNKVQNYCKETWQQAFTDKWVILRRQWDGFCCGRIYEYNADNRRYLKVADFGEHEYLILLSEATCVTWWVPSQEEPQDTVDLLKSFFVLCTAHTGSSRTESMTSYSRSPNLLVSVNERLYEIKPKKLVDFWRLIFVWFTAFTDRSRPKSVNT